MSQQNQQLPPHIHREVNIINLANNILMERAKSLTPGVDWECDAIVAKCFELAETFEEEAAKRLTKAKNGPAIVNPSIVR